MRELRMEVLQFFFLPKIVNMVEVMALCTTLTTADDYILFTLYTNCVVMNG